MILAIQGSLIHISTLVILFFREIYMVLNPLDMVNCMELNLLATGSMVTCIQMIQILMTILDMVFHKNLAASDRWVMNIELKIYFISVFIPVAL
jgi:hypothetical protein